jgi:hypothetical protein
VRIDLPREADSPTRYQMVFRFEDADMPRAGGPRSPFAPARPEGASPTTTGRGQSPELSPRANRRDGKMSRSRLAIDPGSYDLNQRPYRDCVAMFADGIVRRPTLSSAGSPGRDRALAINVDTGEGPHLTHDEKVRVLRIVREVTDLPIVAGLAGPSTDAAVRQARESRDAGADALLMFPIPAYLSDPLDVRVPVGYLEAVGTVGLPMILFQLQPALAGVNFEPETLRAMASVDGVIGIKEASFDARRFMDTARVIAELPRPITFITGNDNFILESFMLGATGALIGFGAVMTREQVDMIDAWNAGDRRGPCPRPSGAAPRRRRLRPTGRGLSRSAQGMPPAPGRAARRPRAPPAPAARRRRAGAPGGRPRRGRPPPRADCPDPDPRLTAPDRARLRLAAAGSAAGSAGPRAAVTRRPGGWDAAFAPDRADVRSPGP